MERFSKTIESTLEFAQFDAATATAATALLTELRACRAVHATIKQKSAHINSGAVRVFNFDLSGMSACSDSDVAAIAAEALPGATIDIKEYAGAERWLRIAAKE